MVIGVFKPDTPKEGILAAWSTVKDNLCAFLSADMEIDPPFLLGSVLHIQCPGPSASRYVAAAFRQRSISMTMENMQYKLHSSLQKPPDIRARNKRLMRAAATIHEFFERHLQIETHKTSCWRSSTSVILGKRVCTTRHNLTEGTTTTRFLQD